MPQQIEARATTNRFLCHNNSDLVPEQIESNLVPQQIGPCATANRSLCHDKSYLVPQRMESCATTNRILCHTEHTQPESHVESESGTKTEIELRFTSEEIFCNWI